MDSRRAAKEHLVSGALVWEDQERVAQHGGNNSRHDRHPLLRHGVGERSEIGSIAVGGREGAARTTPIISMSLAAATGWPVFGWTGKQSAWSAAVEPAARPFIALRETRTKREEISAENVVNK